MIRKHLCCVASVKFFIQISYKKDPNYKQTVCLVHFVVHSVESMDVVNRKASQSESTLSLSRPPNVTHRYL